MYWALKALLEVMAEELALDLVALVAVVLVSNFDLAIGNSKKKINKLLLSY